MSIKVQLGIAIEPEPLPVTTSAVVVTQQDSVVVTELPEEIEVVTTTTVSAAAVSVPADSDSVDFPLSRQQRTLWCWAACAKMVLASLGEHNIRQCGIAQSILNKDCCADSCGKKCCNNDCSADNVLTVYENFGVNADRHDGRVSFVRLQAEISEQKLPLEVGIDWGDNNGGHLLVVNGWSRRNTRRWVKLKDPLYGEAEIRYSDLTRYKGGTWVLTWTGFRK